MDEGRSPDWSKLPQDLLGLVVIKLHFIDVLCFKGVCCSFRLAAKVRSSVAPLLMHQSTTDHRDDDEFLPKFGKTVRFLSPDMKALIYSPQRKKCLERLLDKGCCVGSSHGWLVVLDKEVNPFLLNPFSGAEIELPKKETLPGIIDRGFHDIRVDYDGYVPRMSCFMYGTDVSVPEIHRGFLTGNPSSAEDYKVLVFCGDTVAFCCRGDRTWRALSSSMILYDLACHNGRLYTIQLDVFSSPVRLSMRMCTWDLSSTFEIPQECGCIDISDFVKQVQNKFHKPMGRYYLVSSAEGVFFVFRFMANVGAEDRRDFRTVGFEIYKLEGEHGKGFVRVESLPDKAMFLGGSHGIVNSIKEYGCKLKENSIYFTYDHPDTYTRCMNDGIGIFSLENGSVNLLCDVPQKRPAPFWVFPGQK